MSKQQWLGLLHTLFWEVSESYQDTKIFLQALLQTVGENRDDPSLASLSLQWEARAPFSSSYMRRGSFVAVTNWTEGFVGFYWEIMTWSICSASFLWS